MRRLIARAVLTLLVLGGGADAAVETPYFAPKVAQGALPPVDQRLPEEPRVVDMKGTGREPGTPGGTWRMLMGDQRGLSASTKS